MRQWLETCRYDDVADPVQTLFALALAKEQKSLRYYYALERQIEEPLARGFLHAICQAEEQYHRLLTEEGNPLQRWH